MFEPYGPAQPLMDRGPWRTINVLYGRMLLNQSRIAAAVLNDGVEPADLVWLEGVGFACGQDPTTDTTISLERVFRRHRPTNPSGINLDATQVTVGLTWAGASWWNNNGFNVALRAAHLYSTEPLSKLLAHRGINPDCLAVVVDAGLATVIDTARPRCEVPAREVTALALRHAPGHWHAVVSPAGRHVLAV